MQRIWILAAMFCVTLIAGCAQKDTSEASTTPAPVTAAPAPTAAPAAPATAPRVKPDQTAIRTKTFEIPAGTEVSVRNDDTIDSSKAAEGQTYAGEVTEDVKDAAGDVVIPRGADAQLIIKAVQSSGKSDLVVDLKSVSVAGKQYAITASDFVKEGRDGVGANKRTAEFVGGGAAVGALIGAVTGKGKGAAIGAGAGAGGGALAEVLTKGGAVKIPAETQMTFKLDKAVRIVERK